MQISPEQLFAECDRALAAWPFLWDVETSYGLPRGLLLAVGSRETNLTNEVGDGGHGFGVWQLDNRSHVIPVGFMTNVLEQAQAAASMLRAELRVTGGNVDQAADIYNSGRPNDAATTGGNYGTDVVGRLQAIQARYPLAGPTPSIATPSTQEPHMWCTDPESGKILATDADGNLYADQGGIPDMAVCTLGEHPDWHAGETESAGQNPCVGIATWKDPQGQWGYAYITQPKSGSGSLGPVSTYHIARNGTPC